MKGVSRGQRARTASKPIQIQEKSLGKIEG